ncbi:MAG: hypothetical protein HW401_794 [Parcubacteria group bacterium]|nr:hypothetical protein [Parcubacteria group bacterium]
MFEKKIINSKDNSQPNQPSIKKISSIIILLIILFSIAGLIIYLKPLFNKESGMSGEKNKILKRLELYGSGNNPLNTEEKKEIYDNLSGSQIQDYNFSREEKVKMLKALNDK